MGKPHQFNNLTILKYLDNCMEMDVHVSTILSDSNVHQKVTFDILNNKFK